MEVNGNMKQGLCCVVAVMAALTCWGQETQRHSTVEGGKMLEFMMGGVEERTTFYTAMASAFRESAMEDPAKAAAFFIADSQVPGVASMSVLTRWKNEVEDDFSAQQLSDFFTGAIMLPGSLRKQNGIVGLYNPWWDGILLLQVKAEEKTMDGQPFGRIVGFLFMSGEAFRGESLEGEVDCRTVVPEKNPLSPELWRVTAGTRKVFEAIFPLGDQTGSGWGAGTQLALRLESDAALKEKDRERLVVRSALRLQHSVSLLKNNRDAGIAAVLTRLARTGNLYQLYTHFREKNSRPLLQSFAQIPEMFRKDFTPYCYVPTKAGTLYVLVNKKVPRLYVTVSLLPNPTAETSSMEWFDLIQADQLLDAWNNRKEVAE